MIRQLIVGAAIGACALTGINAANAAQPFAAGWNKAVTTNCVFIPGDPTKTPPVSDEVEIFVDIVLEAPPPPAPPPPILAQGSFTTTDPVAITLIAPYCKDGTPFFFYWDTAKQIAVYFSIYPNLM